jgi:hypothetical protein
MPDYSYPDELEDDFVSLDPAEEAQLDKDIPEEPSEYFEDEEE